jgi:hypothetical protein
MKNATVYHGPSPKVCHFILAPGPAGPSPLPARVPPEKGLERVIQVALLRRPGDGEVEVPV